MQTQLKVEDEPMIRLQIEWAQNSLNEAFALIVKRLREKADDIERMATRVKDAGERGDVGAGHENVADAILNEIAWLTPNLPTAHIAQTARHLARYQGILQQMGVLVTDEERAQEADRAEKKAIVDLAQGMIERGHVVKIAGRKVAEVTMSAYGLPEIFYRLAGRKYARPATTDEVEELKAADNPSYVSRRSTC